jgi:hypothetical protein
MTQKKKNIKNKSQSKKRTGDNHYVGKFEHIFNHAWTEDEIKAFADELIGWMETEPKNLWFKDFLVEKRINATRLKEFCDKNEYFSKVYSLCKDIQESRMFKMGTSKTVNPAMFIIGLKNNHNWKDKQEIEHIGGITVVRDTIASKLASKKNASTTE